MTLSTTASTRLGCAASVIFSFRASLCASKLKAGVSVDMAVTAYKGSFKTRDCTRAYHQRETRRFSFLFSEQHTDRKSTRLNSSHSSISYAVFCLKKKN